MDGHRKKVTFKVTRHNVPLSRIDHKWSFTCHLSVGVCFGHDPGRAIRNSKIQDLAFHNQIVKTIHDLLDATCIVPEMDIKQIDVGGSQLLERILNGDVHGLDTVTRVENLLFDRFVVGVEMRIARILISEITEGGNEGQKDQIKNGEECKHNTLVAMNT